MSKRYPAFLVFVFLVSAVLVPLVYAQNSKTEPDGDRPAVQSSDGSSEDSSTKTSELRSSVEIFAEYQQKLENLASKCDERGMTLEAKVTRSLIYKKQPYFFDVSLLSSKPLEAKLPGDATKEQQSWYAALRRLRENIRMRLLPSPNVWARANADTKLSRAFYRRCTLTRTINARARLWGFLFTRGNGAHSGKSGELKKDT